MSRRSEALPRSAAVCRWPTPGKPERCAVGNTEGTAGYGRWTWRHERRHPKVTRSHLASAVDNLVRMRFKPRTHLPVLPPRDLPRSRAGAGEAGAACSLRHLLRESSTCASAPISVAMDQVLSARSRAERRISPDAPMRFHCTCHPRRKRPYEATAVTSPPAHRTRPHEHFNSCSSASLTRPSLP